MELEKVISNTLHNPACALLRDHSWKTVCSAPVTLVCRNCGERLALPPDLLFHAEKVSLGAFRLTVPAKGTIVKDVEVADGSTQA